MAACGALSTAAVSEAGVLWAWGAGDDGQLGGTRYRESFIHCLATLIDPRVRYAPCHERTVAAVTCSIVGAAPGLEVDSTVRWCLARQMPRAALEDRRAR